MPIVRKRALSFGLKVTFTLKLAYTGVSSMIASLLLFGGFCLGLGSAIHSSDVVCLGFNITEASTLLLVLPWFPISFLASIYLFWRPGVSKSSIDNIASFTSLSYCVVLFVPIIITWVSPGINIDCSWILFALTAGYYAAWSAVNTWLFVRYVGDSQIPKLKGVRSSECVVALDHAS